MPSGRSGRRTARYPTGRRRGARSRPGRSVGRPRCTTRVRGAGHRCTRGDRRSGGGRPIGPGRPKALTPVLDRVAGELDECLLQRTGLRASSCSVMPGGGGEFADALDRRVGTFRAAPVAGAVATSRLPDQRGPQFASCGRADPHRRLGRLAMKSAVLASAISRPRPMTIRWSAVNAISDSRWEDTNTVRPCAARLFMNVRIQRMPSGSSPFTGSSNSSTSGSPSSAPARPSRCFMPRENLPTALPATLLSPTVSSTSSTRARGSRWTPPSTAGGPAPIGSGAPSSRPAARRPCAADGAARRRADRRSAPARCRVVQARGSSASSSTCRRRWVPRKPVTPPGWTVNDRSSTATVEPYRFVRPIASIIRPPRAQHGM